MNLSVKVIVVCFFSFVACSIGEKRHQYTSCMTICKDIALDSEENVCVEYLFDHLIMTNENKLKDKIYENKQELFWDSISECRYKCMIAVEKLLQLSYPIFYRPSKYFGKWPFIRCFGIQEFASTIFSVLNLIVHLQFLKKSRKLHLTKKEFYVKSWFPFCYTGIVVWSFSAIFHAKDTSFTQMLDYFAVVLNVYSGTYCSTIDYIQSLQKYKYIYLLLVGFHMGYILSSIFDYTLNVLLIGSIQCLGSFMFFLKYYKVIHHTHVQKGLISHILLFISGFIFEVWLDFPPFLGILDSHSLWHFSTIFIWILFYQFIEEEAIYRRKLSY